MNFGIKNIILVAVLVLLLMSMLMQGYNMWSLAKSAAGVEATAFWADHKIGLITPTVGNLIGMALLGILLVMG